MNFGDTLQTLRREMGLTQKEFAELISVPQPSISAYENNRNSPTMEVLIGIAQKCHVSLDWLCGLSASPKNISTLSDIAEFLYMMMELNEVGAKIEVYDRTPDSKEWCVKIVVDGNAPQFKYNSDFCNMLRQIRDNCSDLEIYAISEDLYNVAKEKTINYYGLPLSKKVFPQLSREEQLKKHLECLKRLEEN